MKKYLSVLHDYESNDFFEPGIAKKPGFDLQRKAIEVLLQKRDAKQVQEFITSADQKFFAQDYNSETNQVTGIVFFSAESLRKKNRDIDLELFNSLFKNFAELFVIVESISIDNQQEFLSVSKRFVALNYCAQRDASNEWRELVAAIANKGITQ